MSRVSHIVTREMRRQLERDNAKQPFELRPVAKEFWPDLSRMTNPPYAVLRSRFYLVQMFQEHDGITRLSVNRTILIDHRWGDNITWEELMDIKRQAGLGDYYAVEVYPKDRDTVNVANMRHLWVLREPLAIGWFKP